MIHSMCVCVYLDMQLLISQDCLDPSYLLLASLHQCILSDDRLAILRGKSVCERESGVSDVFYSTCCDVGCKKSCYFAYFKFPVESN